MRTKKVKISQKKKKTTLSGIADFIKKTGFILEMEVSEIFKKQGYEIIVNDYFFDYDENKKREIDIIASKRINEIDVIFIIECKQSLLEDWIFVCSDKRPRRYYNYLKHLPEVQTIKEAKLFNHLHTLNQKIPLAQNSIIRQQTNGKRSDSKDIYECVRKLPKIVVDKVYSTYKDTSKTNRNIIFPITIFSGQIFTAEYNNNLIIQEVKIVQYGIELDSRAYTYRHNYNRLTAMHINTDNDNRLENTPIAETCRLLGQFYLIDFVTKKGLIPFLKRIEKEIKNIDLNLWPLQNN